MVAFRIASQELLMFLERSSHSNLNLVVVPILPITIATKFIFHPTEGTRRILVTYWMHAVLCNSEYYIVYSCGCLGQPVLCNPKLVQKVAVFL